jgi:GDP-D-mannose dehydratase
MILTLPKLGRNLAWEPKVKFQGLVEMMVEADLKRLKETL